MRHSRLASPLLSLVLSSVGTTTTSSFYLRSYILPSVSLSASRVSAGVAASSRDHYLIGLQTKRGKHTISSTTTRSDARVNSIQKRTTRMSSSTTSHDVQGDNKETTTTTTTAVVPSISSRVQNTLDPCVVLMKELIGRYAHLWQDKGGIYSLAQGVVYWHPPASAKQALVQAVQDDATHTYGPDEGLPELRTKLQDKLREENGLDQHTVMVTVGANQAYVNCVLTLMNQSQKCVVFAPYYFNHVMAIQMSLPKESLVVGPSLDTGVPDLDWLEKSLQSDSSIHMVTIVNPGNPTGVTLSRDVLQRAVDLCKQYNCWLILDCTYEYFIANREVDEFCCFNEPHVIHIFSFSKSYALAGYRCGYVALPQQHSGQSIFEQMLKVQDTIPITPSRIAQLAAMGAMQQGKPWVQEQYETLVEGRKAILKALAPLEKTMGGTGAMYVMAKLNVDDDQEFCRKLVSDYGVAVIPGSFCGFPGWIRVCYSNLSPELCLQAAQRLEKGIQELCSL